MKQIRLGMGPPSIWVVAQGAAWSLMGAILLAAFCSGTSHGDTAKATPVKAVRQTETRSIVVTKWDVDDRPHSELPPSAALQQFCAMVRQEDKKDDKKADEEKNDKKADEEKNDKKDDKNVEGKKDDKKDEKKEAEETEDPQAAAEQAKQDKKLIMGGRIDLDAITPGHLRGLGRVMGEGEAPTPEEKEEVDLSKRAMWTLTKYETKPKQGDPAITVVVRKGEKKETDDKTLVRGLKKHMRNRGVKKDGKDVDDKEAPKVIATWFDNHPVLVREPKKSNGNGTPPTTKPCPTVIIIDPSCYGVTHPSETIVIGSSSADPCASSGTTWSSPATTIYAPSEYAPSTTIVSDPCASYSHHGHAHHVHSHSQHAQVYSYSEPVYSSYAPAPSYSHHGYAHSHSHYAPVTSYAAPVTYSAPVTSSYSHSAPTGCEGPGTHP